MAASWVAAVLLEGGVEALRERKERYEIELTCGPKGIFDISRNFSLLPTGKYYFNRRDVHWQITMFMKCFPTKISLGSVLGLKSHITSVL